MSPLFVFMLCACTATAINQRNADEDNQMSSPGVCSVLNNIVYECDGTSRPLSDEERQLMDEANEKRRSEWDKWRKDFDKRMNEKKRNFKKRFKLLARKSRKGALKKNDVKVWNSDGQTVIEVGNVVGGKKGAKSNDRDDSVKVFGNHKKPTTKEDDGGVESDGLENSDNDVKPAGRGTKANGRRTGSKSNGRRNGQKPSGRGTGIKSTDRDAEVDSFPDEDDVDSKTTATRGKTNPKKDTKTAPKKDSKLPKSGYYSPCRTCGSGSNNVRIKDRNSQDLNVHVFNNAKL